MCCALPKAWKGLHRAHSSCSVLSINTLEHWPNYSENTTQIAMKINIRANIQDKKGTVPYSCLPSALGQWCAVEDDHDQRSTRTRHGDDHRRTPHVEEHRQTPHADDRRRTRHCRSIIAYGDRQTSKPWVGLIYRECCCRRHDVMIKVLVCSLVGSY